jgi:putative addiction module killer protein
MFEVFETQRYRKWLKGLKDSRVRIRIGMRIERLEQGNPGDHKDLGDISELRIDYGPGYRVYYTQQGKKIIVLLAGGDKRTQEKDIVTARKLAQNFREKRDHD